MIYYRDQVVIIVLITEGCHSVAGGDAGHKPHQHQYEEIHSN